MSNDGKPYWEMSRLQIDNLGKYDRLFKDQKLRISKCKTREQERVQKALKFQQKQKELQKEMLNELQKFTDPSENIELVGYKPSEYRAYRTPSILRGMTAPIEHGSRDAFKDYNTPIQIHKKFSGSPILSVPLRSSNKSTSRNNSSSLLPPKRKRKLAGSIHEVLFEESIKHHEAIDPWGYSIDEKVVCPEIVFHGIKLKVSSMEK